MKIVVGGVVTFGVGGGEPTLGAAVDAVFGGAALAGVVAAVGGAVAPGPEPAGGAGDAAGLETLVARLVSVLFESVRISARGGAAIARVVVVAGSDGAVVEAGTNAVVVVTGGGAAATARGLADAAGALAPSAPTIAKKLEVLRPAVMMRLPAAACRRRDRTRAGRRSCTV